MKEGKIETGCCPRFDPRPWQDKTITWKEKLFVKDRVRSLFHIPLNFAQVMARDMAMIHQGGALAAPQVVLADENSLWGADTYIAVTKQVEGATMATLSGTFLSKVFEGPYKEMRTWVKEMQAHVARQGKRTKRLYFYYTTCPKCAKAYGKNYVVLLAQV